MGQQEIENAIERILNGQIDDYSLIVKQYQKQLLKYVRYLTNGKCDVEDIVQEVFIRIYQNLSKYQLGTSFSNWAYRITFNHTMNMLKKQNRHKILLFGKIPEYAQSPNSSSEISHEVKEALSKLSIEERNLIYLRVYEDLSYRKISQIQNVSESALRKKYERARKKFIKAYIKEDSDYENRSNENTDIRLCK